MELVEDRVVLAGPWEHLLINRCSWRENSKEAEDTLSPALGPPAQPWYHSKDMNTSAAMSTVLHTESLLPLLAMLPSTLLLLPGVVGKWVVAPAPTKIIPVAREKQYGSKVG